MEIPAFHLPPPHSSHVPRRSSNINNDGIPVLRLSCSNENDDIPMISASSSSSSSSDKNVTPKVQASSSCDIDYIPILHLCDDFLVVSKPADLRINDNNSNNSNNNNNNNNTNNNAQDQDPNHYVYNTNQYRDADNYDGINQDRSNGDADINSSHDIGNRSDSNNSNRTLSTSAAAPSPAERTTLASSLRLLFPHLASPSLPHYFRFIHRLDFSTSGAICLALNAAAAKRASRQFERRRVVKLYAALLRGWLYEGEEEPEKRVEEEGEERNGDEGGRKVRSREDEESKLDKDGLVSSSPIVVTAPIGPDTRPGHEHKMTTTTTMTATTVMMNAETTTTTTRNWFFESDNSHQCPLSSSSSVPLSSSFSTVPLSSSSTVPQSSSHSSTVPQSPSSSSVRFRTAETHFHVLSRGFYYVDGVDRGHIGESVGVSGNDVNGDVDGRSGVGVDVGERGDCSDVDGVFGGKNGPYDDQNCGGGGEKATLVLVSLKSGRRHQIRLHAKEIGHPIVGDFTYADDRRARRMYLHACRLVIPAEEKGGGEKKQRQKLQRQQQKPLPQQPRQLCERDPQQHQILPLPQELRQQELPRQQERHFHKESPQSLLKEYPGKYPRNQLDQGQQRRPQLKQQRQDRHHHQQQQQQPQQQPQQQHQHHLAMIDVEDSATFEEELRKVWVENEKVTDAETISRILVNRAVTIKIQGCDRDESCDKS